VLHKLAARFGLEHQTPVVGSASDYDQLNRPLILFKVWPPCTEQGKKLERMAETEGGSR
jgi:hypothetical protein